MECQLTPGWYCDDDEGTYECETECGDGIVAGDEECDFAEDAESTTGCTGCMED